MSSRVNDVILLKHDPAGKLLFRYEGRLLSQAHNEALVEAFFGLESRHLVDIPLNKGDRFLESYYSDRWFNIYEIRGREDDRLKAWYCNVAAPAVIAPGQISFRDFALDLLVYPDGRQRVLDEDEFARLVCTEEERRFALDGLAQLQEHFRDRFLK